MSTFGRIIAPYTQIQDFNGGNNTRGLMYVYVEPNTTTRATLYKESNHEELTNPLVINDIGQVEDFVVDADYKYWIYVTDLDNNKIFDRHNLATMEEGGGQASDKYYDGDFIHIDESNRINVDPTKLLSFQTPLTVEESDDEIVIGVDTSNINVNLEGKNGITTTKQGKKWIVNGSQLKEWQDNHGKTLTVNVDGTATTFDGTADKTVTITSPEVNNGSMTVKVQGTTKQTFTANQSDNKEVDITRNDLDVYSKSEVDSKCGSIIPSIETASHGDVLTVKNTGAYGTKVVSWESPATEIFVGTYTGNVETNTPFADYVSANNEGKLCLVKYTVLGGDVIMILDTIDSAQAVFTRGVKETNGTKSTQRLVVKNDNTYTFESISLEADDELAYVQYNVSTEADIAAAVASGKPVILKSQDGKTIMGVFKYELSSAYFFNGIPNASPMHQYEIWYGKADGTAAVKGWSQVIHYPTDATSFSATTRWTIERTNDMSYQRQHTGTENMNWSTYDFFSTSKWKDYTGAELDNKKEIEMLKTANIRTAKYNFSLNLRLLIMEELSLYIKPRLKVSLYRRDTYTDGRTIENACYTTPIDYYRFQNFENTGNGVQSDWVHVNYSVTIPRNLFQTIVNSTDISDVSYFLKLELENLTMSDKTIYYLTDGDSIKTVRID